MKVLLATPRGPCAGVDRAVETVERALADHGAPVYVRKQIVHDKHVVEETAGTIAALRARFPVAREHGAASHRIGGGAGHRPRGRALHAAEGDPRIFWTASE